MWDRPPSSPRPTRRVGQEGLQTRAREGAPMVDATAEQLQLLAARNERLVAALTAARDQILTLKEQLDELARPPGGYAVFLSKIDASTADVVTAGRKMHLAVAPEVDLDALVPGQEVRLNEAMVVVSAGGFDVVGELGTVREELLGGRLLVVLRSDTEHVVRLAGQLADHGV